MPEKDFWRLIEVLGGSADDDDAVARLTEVLRARGRRAAIAFQERLALTLYELDREALACQPVRWTDIPELGPFPLSDDTFLYLRAGMVAEGRHVVEQVLADPAVLATRSWNDGEPLLYAANDAVGEEIEMTVSYETGSNVRHWRSLQDDAPR
jgi:hypothetical protein